MPNQLSLAARYRNAKAERVPYERMSPALQCMDDLADYREARERFADTRDFADWSHLNDIASYDMEYARNAFNIARARLRLGFRRSASTAQLERLADNPTQMVA